MLREIRIYIAALLLLFTTNIVAQEELGYVNSTYAGINSTTINPSFNVDSRLFVDVHLIGAHLFFHNNVGYYPQENYHILRGAPGDMEVDDRENTKRGFLKAEIMGPSVGVSWKQHSFGIISRFRNYGSAQMSPGLFMMILNGFDYDPYLGQSFKEKGNLSFLSWLEIGLNYGYMHKLDEKHTLDFGFTLKRLNGIGSFGFNVDPFDYTVNNNNTIGLTEVAGGFRSTEFGLGQGKGWGLDFGINYQKKLYDIERYEPNAKGTCKHIDYKYKIGFSILDAGFLFFGKSASFRQFEYASETLYLDSTNLSSPSEFDAYANQNFTNNGTQPVPRYNFYALTPLSVSLQFDYNFTKGFYINATTINSIPLAYNVKKIDVISITPRYERKWFEVALPMSFIGYNYPQLGLAFRFGNYFVIGSNRLSSLIGNVRDVYGADIYFHLKFAFIRKCNKEAELKKARTRRRCAAYK